jgi:hypothetical protein
MMNGGFKHCPYIKYDEWRIQTVHALSMMIGGFKHCSYIKYDEWRIQTLFMH